MSAEGLLRALGELGDLTRTAAPTDVVGDTADFIVLRNSLSRSSLFAAEPDRLLGRSSTLGISEAIDRMKAADKLHAHERILRIGWLWFSGTVTKDGESIRYLFPAVSVPVEVKRTVLSALADHEVAEAIGDAEVSPLIADSAVRDELLTNIEMGGGAITDLAGRHGLLDRLPKLRAWSRRVSDAAGIEVEGHVLAGAASPMVRRSDSGIVANYLFALYIDRTLFEYGREDALNVLAHHGVRDDTAFSKLYWPVAHTGPETDAAPEPNTKVRPLSRQQVSVLQKVRSTPVAAITGAPGNGKSHVVTSLAIDAVAQGQSVLVVGSSPHAVDVLVEHFSQTPGAIPVTFGGSRHGGRLADELLELRAKASTYSSSNTSNDEYETLRQNILSQLDSEAEAAAFSTDPATRLSVVESLDRAGDLPELEALVEDACDGGLGGVLGRRHRREVAHRLGIGAFDAEMARAAFARLKRSDQARRLVLVEGLDLEQSLTKLVLLEKEHFAANGRRIIATRNADRPRNADHIVGRVALALRADRVTRRRWLSEINSDQLVKAVPLWVGMAKDVADVLPPDSAMFDLVIIDEAAQLDQVSAAHALVRAKEAVVCGDSNQLGFATTITDDQVADVLAVNELDVVVDPARSSTLDLASAAGPTHQLTEHFRSAPHLIEFSSRRFYGGQVVNATRRPGNESADHIDVHIVEGGTRTSAPTGEVDDGVNHDEIKTVIELLRESVNLGWRSIGVISPFQAQADAVEAAILETYRPEEVAKYGLRVGTVQSFQGDERDLIIMTWVLGPEDEPSAWEFVNQRERFNVMVTRARHNVIVVTSVAKPPGLAGEYVQWSVPLENLIDDVGSSHPWVNQVADACRDVDIPVRVGYPVGLHVVDLVLGEGDKAVAVDCVPHPNGPDAHLDRALLLRRTGWLTADAYQSRWHAHVGELAIELARRIERSK